MKTEGNIKYSIKKIKKDDRAKKYGEKHIEGIMAEKRKEVILTEEK